MRFDLLIRGGEVVDPGAGLLGRLDVGVADGRVLSVESGLPAAEAREVLDATGQIVTPGLVDLHTHVYWGATYWGIEPDPIAARTGVTTWVDAGTVGAYGWPGYRRHVVEGSEARLLTFLNVSSIGLTAPTGELACLDYLDLDLARLTVESNRDAIVGIKARIDSATTRGTGITGLRRARELADSVDLPLMVHVGSAPPSLAEIVALLRPGDVLTHAFTGNANRIVDDGGRLLDFVRAAWDAGLVVDLGHGSGSFSYLTAEALLAQGRLPDVISTDNHQLSVQGPMYDLPTTLSKFLNLGLSLAEVIERATSRPAAVLRRPDLGTLRPGSVADVALFEMVAGDFAFSDVHGNARRGTRRLASTATIRAGRPMARRDERPVEIWARPR